MSFQLAALLLLSLGAGPYGLGLVTPQLLNFLDPAIAVAAAVIGAFVGLSAATSDKGRRVTTTLLVLGGGVLVAALRSDSVLGAIGLALGVSVVSVLVAIAGWLLVGHSSSEGEQRTLVAGTLLLIGGAATYLSLSAVLAGFLAGLTWSAAGNLGKARIVRDLGYLQHPLVLLALFVAGASAQISLNGVMSAVALMLAASIVHLVTQRFSHSSVPGDLVSANSLGLVAIALALDCSRSDARPEWALTLLGATVMAAMAAGLSSIRFRTA